MGKYFVCLLGMVLMFASRVRADITLTNGSPDLFAAAVSDTINAGGGTIIVTTPIVIGSTNGGLEPLDGESLVTVSGGNTNSIFIVESGSLELANMTLANGSGTMGGAMFIDTNGTATLTGCTFFNNHVHGADGVSATPLNDRSNAVVIGRDGGRGTAGSPAYGGAIFSYGDLSLFDCKFITNSASGGTGGDGADGESAGTKGGKGGSGGAGASAAGGGVFNFGTLVVSNCTFSGNLAQGGSGGIGGAGGSANISGATGFSGAAGIAGGGGLYTADLNTTLIANSTFDHNTAHGGDSSKGGRSAGGIGQNGPRGGDALGGGIDITGPAFVVNSTFFQNNALGGSGGDGGDSGARGGNGGAGGSAIGGDLYNASFSIVVNCTFSKGNALGGTNGAPGSGAVAGKNGKRGSNFGGSLANVAKKKKGSVQLFNSIIAAALSGGGGYGTISNGGFNISADKSIKFQKGAKSFGSLMNTNPLVGDLGDNGGPTQTIPLQTNSPAIDKITNNLALTPVIDQRGFHRPIGTYSDIGAYELDVNRATIITPPQSTNVFVGSNATFTVTAGGTGPFFYQWFFNNAPISGATTNFLTITNAQTNNAGPYRVVVTNSFNAATSSVATLGVFVFSNSPPLITQQPTNSQTVLAGTTVSIGLTAVGTEPLSYRWFFQPLGAPATNITGLNTNAFTIVNAQTNFSGIYFAIITNNFGSVTSAISTLAVTNPPVININPNSLSRIKGAPAPAIQMTSSPGAHGNSGTKASANCEVSMEEPSRGRARHSVRAGIELALRSENPKPPSTRRAGILPVSNFFRERA